MEMISNATIIGTGIGVAATLIVGLLAYIAYNRGVEAGIKFLTEYIEHKYRDYVWLEKQDFQALTGYTFEEYVGMQDLYNQENPDDITPKKPKESKILKFTPPDTKKDDQ